MYKKTVKYVDFNGTEREEDLYFHLSLPEVTRIEAEAGDSLKDHLTNLVKDNNMKELLGFLEKIILMSYGTKTPDGRSFIKNKEIREKFENSQAYAEFFEMIITTEGMAGEFGEKVAAKKEKRDDQVNPVVVSE